MPKTELKDLSTEQLRKRQRFAGIVLGISTGLFGVLIIVGLMKSDYTLLPIALALLATALPMFLGLKKVKLELKSREKQSSSVN